MSGFWNGKRVLVTGSEGLIGKPLVRMLRKAGALTGEYDLDDGHDVLDMAQLRSELRIGRPQIVIHLAALSNVGQCRLVPHRTFGVLAQGTVNVLEAARLYGHCEAVVTASSNHVYGRQETLPVPEDAHLRNLDPYSVSKICADYMARSYAKVYGLPVAVVRNTNCFGPDDPHDDHLVPSAIMALLHGETVRLRTDGLTRKGYLYVDDVAEAYLAAAEYIAGHPEERGRAFNITSDKMVSAVEMVGAVAAALGLRDWLTEVGQPDPLEQHEWLDDAGSRAALGWRPRHTLQEALCLTVAGFKARQKEAVR